MKNGKQKKDKQKKGMNANEIRNMREEERLNYAYTEPEILSANGRKVLGILATIITTIALLFAFAGLHHLFAYIEGNIRDIFPPAITKIFTKDLIIALFQISTAIILCRVFGSLKMEKPEKNKEIRHIELICLAISSCAVILPMMITRALSFLFLSTFFGNKGHEIYSYFFNAIFSEFTIISDSSEILFYILQILIIPLSNLLLYLLLVEKIESGILSWIYKEKLNATLPMIISTSILLAFGINGHSLFNIGLALVQAASYTVLYYKSKNFWLTFAVYGGTMALTFAVLKLMMLI